MSEAASTPHSVIYGIDSAGATLCIVSAEEARARAGEMNRIIACITVGQLRKLIPQLRKASPPVELDDLDDLPDDHAWSWSDHIDGDREAFASSYALELDWDEDTFNDLVSSTGAVIDETFLYGEQLHIPPENEQALLAFFARHHIAAVRDDNVLSTLDAW